MTKSEALAMLDRIAAGDDVAPDEFVDSIHVARAALADQIAGGVVSEAADVQTAKRHARGERDMTICPVCVLHSPCFNHPCVNSENGSASICPACRVSAGLPSWDANGSETP